MASPLKMELFSFMEWEVGKIADREKKIMAIFLKEIYSFIEWPFLFFLVWVFV